MSHILTLPVYMHSHPPAHICIIATYTQTVCKHIYHAFKHMHTYECITHTDVLRAHSSNSHGDKQEADGTVMTAAHMDLGKGWAPAMVCSRPLDTYLVDPRVPASLPTTPPFPSPNIERGCHIRQGSGCGPAAL